MVLVVTVAIVVAALTSWYLGTHIGKNSTKVDRTSARLISQQQVVNAISQVEMRNCAQIEKVKSIIRGVQIATDRSLGKPGTPGYQYYLTHPQELAGAHRAARSAAAQFAPLPC